MTNEIKQRIQQIKNGQVPTGYKKTKVGIAPIEWEEKKIHDVFTQRKTLMNASENTPLLSFTIEDGVIDPKDKKSNKRDFLIKDISTKKFALTEVDDIIYNPANLKFGAIHRNSLKKGVVSPIYGIFYGQQNSLFMGYLLHNQNFIDYAKIHTEGTVEKLKTLRAETFLKLRITVPPLSEQKKIAKILETQDKIIELYQRKIEELQKQKKFYLSKMFPEHGSNVPEIRFPGFTEAWEQRKLGEVLSLIKDGTHGTHQDVENGPLLLSAKNIKNGRINWDENDRRISQKDYESIHSKFSLNSGDVLLTIVGSIGETAILHDVEGITFQRSVAYLRPTKRIKSNFLYCQIQTPKFRTELDNRKSTSAQPGIYLGDLSIIPVTFPTYIKEQEAIGTLFSNLDNLITLHQCKLEEMKKYKKALMQLLLSGIVRVKSDE